MHKKINNNLSKNFIQGLRPLANTLPTQIKKILKKNGFNLSSIVNHWTRIVRKDVSNKCYTIYYFTIYIFSKCYYNICVLLKTILYLQCLVFRAATQFITETFVIFVRKLLFLIHFSKQRNELIQYCSISRCIFTCQQL